MPTTTKSYPCSDVRQLIDLNGDAVNFRARFTLTSTNQDPFDMLIVDQTMLDNQKELNYKHVTEGTISGQIDLDKNVYQNYFIIIRSDKPTEVTAEIDFQRLPDHVPQPEEFKPPQNSPSPTKNSRVWVKVLIGVGVIAGAVLIYFVFFHNKAAKSEEGQEHTDKSRESGHEENTGKEKCSPGVSGKSQRKTEETKITFSRSPPGKSPAYSESPSLSSSPPRASTRAPTAKRNAQESLLSRLKTFPLK